MAAKVLLGTKLICASALLSLASCANESEIAPEATENPGPVDEQLAESNPDTPEQDHESEITSSDPSVVTQKSARCKVTDPVGNVFEGDCEFESLGGASFTVAREGDAPFFEGNAIVQFVFEADTTEVAGFSYRTDDGNLNYGGSAERSTIDRACWDAEEYQVCAYST